MAYSRVMSLSYTQKYFSVEVKGSQLDYTFKKDQYFNISLVKSPNRGSMTNTIAWDKYGNSFKK